MPELCRFYNIVIKMIFSDTDKHHKPHFHVYYNEYEASVGRGWRIDRGKSSSQTVEAGAGLGCHPRGRTLCRVE